MHQRTVEGIASIRADEPINNHSQMRNILSTEGNEAHERYVSMTDMPLQKPAQAQELESAFMTATHGTTGSKETQGRTKSSGRHTQ